jgi:anti-anti-sigma factor
MKPIDTGSEYFPEAWQDGQTVYCRLAADLNLDAAPWAKVVFNKLIADYKPEKLIVDLRDVKFIDSAGLATLVLARRLMGGAPIVLRDAAAPVKGLMSIAQLAQLFTFENSNDTTTA